MPNPEQVKYEQMWEYEQYRRYAPGEQLVSDFMQHVEPDPGSTIIDFGAGTGRGAHALARLGFDVHMLDFADNCLDPEVRHAVDNYDLQFTKHDLLQPIPIKAEFGYCTDVMEHIAPDDVGVVLDNILGAAEKVFFQISLEHDACGALIDEDLHLTVKPMEWWSEQLAEHKAFVYYASKEGHNAIFYVSRNGNKEYVALNTEWRQLVKNMEHNVAQGYQQCTPHADTTKRLMLLGGGPSLNDYKEEIKRKAEKGMPVICTNGTYNWCLENGITPNALVVVDARAVNEKFVSKVIPNCKYMFASQCHPSLFAKVPHDQVWVWHSHTSDDVEAWLDEQYGSELWYSVPGGTTVMLRAIPLMGMLGWKKLDIYGFDSCLREEEHHAYEQNQNEGLHKIYDVTIGGRKFKCHAWMVVQGQQFDKLYTSMRTKIHMRVFGDGMASAVADLIERKINRS